MADVEKAKNIIQQMMQMYSGTGNAADIASSFAGTPQGAFDAWSSSMLASGKSASSQNDIDAAKNNAQAAGLHAIHPNGQTPITEAEKAQKTAFGETMTNVYGAMGTLKANPQASSSILNYLGVVGQAYAAAEGAILPPEQPAAQPQTSQAMSNDVKKYLNVNPENKAAGMIIDTHLGQMADAPKTAFHDSLKKSYEDNGSQALYGNARTTAVDKATQAATHTKDPTLPDGDYYKAVHHIDGIKQAVNVASNPAPLNSRDVSDDVKKYLGVNPDNKGAGMIIDQHLGQMSDSAKTGFHDSLAQSYHANGDNALTGEARKKAMANAKEAATHSHAHAGDDHPDADADRTIGHVDGIERAANVAPTPVTSRRDQDPADTIPKTATPPSQHPKADTPKHRATAPGHRGHQGTPGSHRGQLKAEQARQHAGYDPDHSADGFNKMEKWGLNHGMEYSAVGTPGSGVRMHDRAPAAADNHNQTPVDGYVLRNSDQQNAYGHLASRNARGEMVLPTTNGTEKGPLDFVNGHGPQIKEVWDRRNTFGAAQKTHPAMGGDTSNNSVSHPSSQSAKPAEGGAKTGQPTNINPLPSTRPPGPGTGGLY